MSNDRKILITGGTGFVGRHLQVELSRRGIPHAVFSKAQCDLTQAAPTDALFRQHADAGTIVHLACISAAADFPAKHTADQTDVNCRIHLNVLAAWKHHLPHAKFFGMGSSCAFPAQEGAIRETQAMAGEIHGSVYAYAFTKRLLLNGIRAYNDQHKLDGTYLIPATMFGEHDDFHPETAHVVGALIGKYVTATLENRPVVEVWGDGTQIRDFLDVKDFVAALLHLMPQAHRDVVNIGPGRGISVRTLAEMIHKASGFKGQTLFKPTGYVGVLEKTIDVGKLNAQYGFIATADHAEAIERTVAWYRENYSRLHGKRKFPHYPPPGQSS